MTNPADLTAKRSMHLIQEGKLRVEELTEAYLDRIAERGILG